MPAAHARAAQMSGPGVPSVSSERMVSMMGVIGWFSANPLSHGVIESVGTNEELMKISSKRI